MIRILILEPISPAGLELLEAEPDFKVVQCYEDDSRIVESCLAEAEVLIVRSKTKVTAELLQRAPQLKIIGRPGSGVDNVDVAAATKRGIIVMNTPAGNSVSAAEHTMGLLLALLRRIPQADSSVRQGRWDRHKFIGTELHGKTLGVLGFGNIGLELVRRAKAFKVDVLVHDPFVSEAIARNENVSLVSLDELLTRSDILTLHVPLTSSTRKIIDAASLDKLKPGSYLVNAARGELVDEEALILALRSGKLAGAALDVFSDEPRPRKELVSLPNVIATPHIGASTAEAQEKVGYDIADQLKEYFKAGIVRNAVNFPSVSMAEYRRIAPYLQLGERLGSFASQVYAKRMEKISVRYYGDLAQMETHLIGTAILSGVLKPILTERVTLVNALAVARERRIHFVESRSSRERGYSNLISLKLIADEGEVWVEGTVSHHNHLRIVSFHGIDVEAPLEGEMLVIQNSDTPGVIGRVGTLLGERQINIANFALGRNQSSQRAVGIVNVDSAISDDVLRGIRSLPQILRAQLVSV